MSVSLTLLNCTDTKGRALFRLNKNFSYQLGPGAKVVVPKGYVTNFGTIPRCAVWFVSPAQLREAAIVHDYLCNEDFEDDDKEVYSGYSRWLADAVLYEAMARLGFSWFKRTIVYKAVRIASYFTTNEPYPDCNEEE